jgi:tape measure domain-containing protein
VARASVELIVEAAKAVNPLRKVEQQSKKLEQAFNKLQRKSKSTFASVGRDAKKTVSAMTNVKNAIAGAAVGFAFFKAGQAGIARAESVRRLEFLAKGYGEVEQAQAAAAKASKKFGISQTEANAAFANIFARLRPVGVSLKDITSIYNGFNTVARLSGATSVEASNAFTQLAQALGSGALRGDEFNSISEQVPGILTAISKETGIAQGSLRKFAAEGKITSDIVLKALKRIETEGADQLKDALGGPAQAIKDFQNATEEVQVALTQDVVPILAESFSGLAELIINLEGPIRFIGGVAADTLNQINSLITQATKPAAAAARRDVEAGLIPTNIVAGLTGGDVRGGAKELFGEAGLADLEERAKEFSKLRGTGFQETLLQFMQDRLKTMDAVPGAGDSSFDPSALLKLKNNGSSKGAAAKERVDMSQELFDLNKRLLGQSDALTEAERIVLNFQIEKQKISEANLLPREEEIALLEAAAGFEQDILDRREEQQKLTDESNKKAAKEAKRQEEEAQRRLEADPGFQMQQQLEKLLETQNQVAFAATSMGNAFANAFGDVVTGAKTGQEALADMLKSIASDFLGMAQKIIAQQLAMILYGTIMKALGVSMPGGGGSSTDPFGTGLDSVNQIGGNGFISPFAEGGYVTGPTNALIGEGGEPEYVIPASKMRESMSRYSRGSRGGGVIPSAGGSSASGDGGVAVAAPIDVRYTVERINSVDYVTADQFQSGMRQAADQGAKQGEQQTLKRLQMSSGTRKRLGM